MAKEKNYIVTRTEHGKSENIRLGDLGKNELCRAIVQTNQENTKLRNALNQAYLTYANHIASQDILSKEEWLKVINESK